MIVQLTNRSLLKLSGTDTQSFLQNILSNDVNAIKDDEVQLSAYCQHQGKIITLFWVMKKANSYHLSFSQDLSSIVVQRLNMFKLMSDVEIEDVSSKVIQLGIISDEFDNAFKLNSNQSIALVDNIDGLDIADLAEWEEACIENNLAEVYLDTTEKFVPQMLNLDIDEAGVSFTKGCYPGQEVVARLHYLGKAKRRMYQFECGKELTIGDELIVGESNSSKASGVVVRSVKLGAKSLCLATLEVEFKDSEVRLNSPEGPILTRIIND